MKLLTGQNEFCQSFMSDFFWNNGDVKKMGLHLRTPNYLILVMQLTQHLEPVVIQNLKLRGQRYLPVSMLCLHELDAFVHCYDFESKFDAYGKDPFYNPFGLFTFLVIHVRFTPERQGMSDFVLNYTS